MSDKPTLIGMAHGNGGRGSALMPGERGSGTGSADRLLGISGMTRDEYLANFRRLNLLPFGHWCPIKARVRGLRIQRSLRGTVIVLGKETWRALGLPRVNFFERVQTELAEFVLLPHPSGRNLIYNYPRNRERARRILRRAAR